jgi:hypothetical protein
MTENTYSWLTEQYCYLYTAFVINLRYTYTGDCTGHISVCNYMKALQRTERNKSLFCFITSACMAIPL